MEDWQRQRQHLEVARLEAEGYRFEVNISEYVVHYRGKLLGAAGVLQPRKRFETFAAVQANLDEGRGAALLVAQRHAQKRTTQVG